jgi:teichuronic acid biosynthesis glycosyltransferase TuaG
MLISVIVPFFNRCELLTKSINSIINQTYQNWELILIDDFSTEIYLRKIHDNRVKIFRNEKNLGPAASRQKGVEISNGEMICFLDSDDVYLPAFLESQIRMHEKHNYEIAFSYCLAMWNNGMFYKDHVEELYFILPNLLVKGRPWPTCALLWNKKFLPQWKNEIRTWEDYQFEFDAAFINNNISFVNEVLCYINLDDEFGLSQNSEKLSGVIDRLKVLSNMRLKNLESNLDFKLILNRNIEFRIKKDIRKLAQFDLSKSEYVSFLNTLNLNMSQLFKFMVKFIYQKPILSKIVFKYFF